MTVMYLFTRVRFNWDEVDFSIFSTYMMVTNLLGTLFQFRQRIEFIISSVRCAAIEYTLTEAYSL